MLLRNERYRFRLLPRPDGWTLILGHGHGLRSSLQSLSFEVTTLSTRSIVFS